MSALKELVEAANYLRLEVRGMEAVDIGILEVVGNTNYNYLQRRRVEVEEALAKLKAEKPVCWWCERCKLTLSKRSTGSIHIKGVRGPGRSDECKGKLFPLIRGPEYSQCPDYCATHNNEECDCECHCE